MPVTYTIDTQQRLLRTRCVGLVTFDEVVAHFQELGRDPECVGHLDVFLDVSETTSLPESGQVNAVSYEVQKIQEKVKFDACAILATRDALFGMMRIFEVAAQQYFREIRVFRVAAEAEAWLQSQRQHSGPVGEGMKAQGADAKG
jgi:hypothetical protein